MQRCNKTHIRKQKARGFTLIELLVVIAIVSLLSSIVITTLNSARDRGGDSFIMSQMHEMRTQTEFYFQTHGVYASGSGAEDSKNECTGRTGTATTNSVFDIAKSDGVAKLIDLIYNQSKESGHERVICAIQPNSWALAVPLRNPPSGYTGWCADSFGISKYVNFITEFDNQSSNKLVVGGIAKCP